MAETRKAPATPLAALVDACIAPALRKRGFVSGDVLARWPDIVGVRLAAGSRPIEIKWPRRPGRDDPDEAAPAATLIVRVEGAFALEFEYARALVIERINALFGWRCIGRVQIRQGPVLGQEAPRTPPPRPLSPEERARVAGLAAGTEEKLSAALMRLGEAVISSRKMPKGP